MYLGQVLPLTENCHCGWQSHRGPLTWGWRSPRVGGTRRQWEGLMASVLQAPHHSSPNPGTPRSLEFSGSKRTSLQGQGISLPLQQSDIHVDRHVNRRKVPALHQAPCWVLPLRTHSTQTITLQVDDWYPGEEKMEARFFVILPFPTSQRHHVRKYSNWEVYMSYRIQEF